MSGEAVTSGRWYSEKKTRGPDREYHEANREPLKDGL